MRGSGSADSLTPRSDNEPTTYKVRAKLDGVNPTQKILIVNSPPVLTSASNVDLVEANIGLDGKNLPVSNSSVDLRAYT
jgi:hypothetical protein